MAMSPKRPQTRRGKVLAIGGIVATIGVAGFVFAYFVLFPTSSPKRLALSPSTTSSAGASSGSFAGSWTVATGSTAGYRVREQLAFLPAQSDAVGRTSAVTGKATLTQSGKVVQVKTASFDVDVSALTSDRSMRDQRIHSIGLESDHYPTATFVLASPITLPATGRIVKLPATGVFTVHGTARTKTVPLQLRLSGTTLEAAGSITFPWSDFKMTAPSVGGFVQVTDSATMEFALRLRQAS